MNANQVEKWIDEIMQEELVRKEKTENNLSQNPEDRRVSRWKRRLEGISVKMELLQQIKSEIADGANWVDNAHTKEVLEGWIACHMHSGDVF